MRNAESASSNERRKATSANLHGCGYAIYLIDFSDSLRDKKTRHPESLRPRSKLKSPPHQGLQSNEFHNSVINNRCKYIRNYSQ